MPEQAKGETEVAEEVKPASDVGLPIQSRTCYQRTRRSRICHVVSASFISLNPGSIAG
jgi:hypothetical protein